MADQMNMPAGGQGNQSQRNTIIAVVTAVVLLCCCCLGGVAAWWLWNNGDALMEELGLLQRLLLA